jgi:hypothetical protein
VSESRFSIRLNETDDELGVRLGVQASVIQEARAIHQKGHPDAKLGRWRYRTQRGFWRLDIEPPKEIFEEWEAYRKRLDVPTTMLARSVIHHVLQRPTQPDWLAARNTVWPWNGKVLKSEKKHEYRIRVDVTEAAHIALHRRAEATQCTMAGIVRWGVLMLISGRIKNLEIFPGLSRLFDDPTRYCLNPQITKKD